MAPLAGAKLLPDGGRVLVILTNERQCGLLHLDGSAWDAWPNGSLPTMHPQIEDAILKFGAPVTDSNVLG